MKRRKVPLSSDGDERRIIKHADIDLYEITKGFLFEKRTYEAVHRPTGIKSGPAWYASSKPDWATSDCIAAVLDHECIRMDMGQIDRVSCDILR